MEPKGAIVLHDGVDPDEVALEDGDVLRIPRESNTVAVQGEVFIPTSFVHQEGKSVDYYLEQAGGMTQPGNSDRVYVKRVNGEIAIAQGGLFTRTRVKPGDEITVRERCRGQLRIKSALEIAEQLGFVPWVDVDSKAFKGVLKAVPDRAELSQEIDESLVVALYSK